MRNKSTSYYHIANATIEKLLKLTIGPEGITFAGKDVVITNDTNYVLNTLICLGLLTAKLQRGNVCKYYYFMTKSQQEELRGLYRPPAKRPDE